MSGFHGARYCWMNGEVTETKDALVSAMEPFHYGIFEGIRAYVEGDILGEGDLNIFRCTDIKISNLVDFYLMTSHLNVLGH